MGEERPLLADGSIIEDYRPLLTYWRIARRIDKKLAEKAILSNEDFNELSNIVRYRERISLEELLDIFKKRFIQRIDPNIAAQAFKEVYGITIPEDSAREKIAYIMAGWLLEASRRLKIIGYRSWRDSLREGSRD